MKAIVNTEGVLVAADDNILETETEFVVDDSHISKALGVTLLADVPAPPAALSTWDGAQWVEPTRPPVDPLPLIAQIDADADAIYRAVLGDRAEEYTAAAEQAKAFKDAGYTGTPPDSVQSWMDAKGWSAQQATDDILATAAAWQDARKNIRANRLLRKEQIRAAADAAAQETALAAWRAFRDGIRAQLGLPPVQERRQ